MFDLAFEAFVQPPIHTFFVALFFPFLEHCVKPGWDTLGEGYSCVLGQRLDAEGNGQNDFTFRLRYFAWVRPPSWEPNATHFESWTERISILLEGSFGSTCEMEGGIPMKIGGGIIDDF